MDPYLYYYGGGYYPMSDPFSNYGSGANEPASSYGMRQFSGANNSKPASSYGTRPFSGANNYEPASSHGTRSFSGGSHVDWKDMAPGLSKDWWQFPTAAPPGPPLPPPLEAASSMQPYVDMKETPTSYVYIVDVPGVKKEEIMRAESDRVLQIWWEQPRDSSGGDTWRAVERYTGRFLRRIYLPRDADENEISLVVENGVLTINVPKILVAAAAPEQPENEPVAVAASDNEDDDFVMV